MNRFAIIPALLAALLLAGCNTNPLTPTSNLEAVEDVDLIKTSHAATAALVRNLHGKLDPAVPILVASFVNTDDLTESSTFGRIVGEQMATALSNQGYTIVELKLRSTMFVQKAAGEFILSRELAHLVNEYQAQAVLAGIYAAGRDEVFVTAKLIRVTDSVVLASHDFAVPVGPNVRAMLRGAGRGGRR